jgi:hypothetical protein
MSLCMCSIVFLVISDHGAFNLSSVCFLQKCFVVLLSFLLCHVYSKIWLTILFCRKNGGEKNALLYIHFTRLCYNIKTAPSTHPLGDRVSCAISFRSWPGAYQLFFSLMHLTIPLQVFPNRLMCICINRNNIGVSSVQLDNRMVDHLNNFGSDVRQLFGELIDTYVYFGPS